MVDQQQQQPSAASGGGDTSRSSPDPYGDDWDDGFVDAVVTMLAQPSATPAVPPVPPTSTATAAAERPAGPSGPPASVKSSQVATLSAGAVEQRPPVKHVEIELAENEADAQPIEGASNQPLEQLAGDEMVDDVVATGESTSTPPERPRSLFQLFRSRRGYFSVTDLCAPVWCEVQYDYGLRGKRFLPVAERPTTFLSARGQTITPDVEQAMFNAKIMDAGSVIHHRLEKEIHPVEVKVDVTTREERWALRLLNMLAAVEALLELGICREMPVMGFIKGQFVVGVVDEIQRRPLAVPLTDLPVATVPDTVSSQATIVSLPVVGSQAEATRSSARSSPRKKPARTASVAPKPTPITNFFRPKDVGPIVLNDEEDKVAAVIELSAGPSPSAPANPAAGGIVAPASSPATASISAQSSGFPAASQAISTPSLKPTHGLFVSDSKTRRSYSLPRDDASLSGRLQCQLYKLLLDNLLAPVRSPSTSPSSQLPAELATSTLSLVFAQFDLDPTAPLSDGFCAQAQALIDGNAIKVDWSNGRALTLDALARCWDASVDRLGIDRRRGVDDELQLVYRYQSPVSKPTGSGKGKGKRKARRGKESTVPSTPAQSGEDRQLQLATQASLADEPGGKDTSLRAPVGVSSPVSADDLNDDQLQLAIKMSLAAVDSGPSASPAPIAQPESEPASPPANPAGSAATARSPQPGATRAVQAESSIERIDDGPVEVPEGAFDPSPAPLVLGSAPPTAWPAPLTASLSVAVVEDMLAAPPALTISATKKEQTAELMRLKLFELKVLARKEGQPDWGAKNVLADRIYKARAERLKLKETSSGPAEMRPAEKRAKRSNVNTAASSARLPPLSVSPLRSTADDDIIGVKTFRYEAAELGAHLDHVLAFWLGEREPIGVPLDETFKCNSCELRESCEWRAEEADRIWTAHAQARAAASTTRADAR